MPGTEVKSYSFTCDESGCENTAGGTLESVETTLNWFFKVVDGNGVPTECYCNDHRSLHE